MLNHVTACLCTSCASEDNEPFPSCCRSDFRGSVLDLVSARRHLADGSSARDLRRPAREEAGQCRQVPSCLRSSSSELGIEPTVFPRPLHAYSSLCHKSVRSILRGARVREQDIDAYKTMTHTLAQLLLPSLNLSENFCAFILRNRPTSEVVKAAV